MTHSLNIGGSDIAITIVKATKAFAITVQFAIVIITVESTSAAYLDELVAWRKRLL